MKSEQPRVPVAVAVVVIAIIAIAAWFALRQFATVHHDGEPKKAAVLLVEPDLVSV